MEILLILLFLLGLVIGTIAAFCTKHFILGAIGVLILWSIFRPRSPEERERMDREHAEWEAKRAVEKAKKEAEKAKKAAEEAEMKADGQFQIDNKELGIEYARLLYHYRKDHDGNDRDYRHKIYVAKAEQLQKEKEKDERREREWKEWLETANYERPKRQIENVYEHNLTIYIQYDDGTTKMHSQCGHVYGFTSTTFTIEDLNISLVTYDADGNYIRSVIRNF